MLAFADIIITSIAIVWLSIACFTDIKKREVPDWISFSLIAIAMSTKLLASIFTSHYSYFFHSLVGLSIFILLGFAFYYAQIFGGGDAKILMALGACFSPAPFFVKNDFPFLLNFFTNMLLIGSAYGIIYSFFLALQNKKNFCFYYKKIKEKKIFYFVISGVSFFLSFFLGTYFLLVSILFILLPYLLSFLRAAEKLMIKQKSWKDLSEGDWLVKEIRIGKKKIKPNVHGITKEDIELIRKAKKKVLIKEGLPFIPAIFLSLILTIIFGNLFFLFF